MIQRDAVHDALSEGNWQVVTDALVQIEEAERVLSGARCHPSSEVMVELRAKGAKVNFHAWNDRGDYAEERRICESCPAKPQCLIRAYVTQISTGDLTGIWAGIPHHQITKELRRVTKLQKQFRKASLEDRGAIQKEIMGSIKIPEPIRTAINHDIITRNE